LRCIDVEYGILLFYDVVVILIELLLFILFDMLALHPSITRRGFDNLFRVLVLFLLGVFAHGRHLELDKEKDVNTKGT